MSEEATKKRVLLRFWFEREVEVPSDWDADMVDFFYNDSSHCLGTEIEAEAREIAEHPGVCNLCHRAGAEVVGMYGAEATGVG